MKEKPVLFSAPLVRAMPEVWVLELERVLP
jgi:hypothetical protein